MTFINDYTEQYNPVTIDRERGISLKRLPTGPDPIYPFVLNWHNQEVKFAGETETTERYQNEEGKWRFNFSWKIRSITLPEGFPENEETVRQVIAEALDCFGEHHDRERIGTIKVEFTPNAFKAQGFY